MQNRAQLRQQQKRWAVFMHLSLLLGQSLLPIVGWLVPILLWWYYKKSSPYLDLLGRKLHDFLLNLLGLYLVSFVLSFVGIGYLFFALVYALGIGLPLWGAYRESQDELVNYPGLFRFFYP